MNFEKRIKNEIFVETSNMSVKKIKKNEIKNVSVDELPLFSEKEIEEIFKSEKRIENENMENKSLNDIFEKNSNALKTLNMDGETIKKIQEKLVDYIFIENPKYIKIGKYIRWVKKSINSSGQYKLNSGASVLKITTNINNEIVLTCKTNNIFLKIKFDDCLIFQKLSFDEKLILCAFEHVKNIS